MSLFCDAIAAVFSSPYRRVLNADNPDRGFAVCAQRRVGGLGANDPGARASGRPLPVQAGERSEAQPHGTATADQEPEDLGALVGRRARRWHCAALAWIGLLARERARTKTHGAQTRRR